MGFFVCLFPCFLLFPYILVGNTGRLKVEERMTDGVRLQERWGGQGLQCKVPKGVVLGDRDIRSFGTGEGTVETYHGRRV